MKRIVRVTIAFVLVLALLRFVGVAELVQVLGRIEISYIFLLLILGGALIWVSCVKWLLFLRAQGHNPPLLHLMKLYTIGYFVNLFTPSFVGGDVARSLHLDISSKKDAFTATFLERFTGLLAMSFLGVFFVAIGSSATAGIELAVLGVGALSLLLAAFCFSERIGSIARRIANILLRKKLLGFFQKVDNAFREARQNKPLLMKSLGLSFAYHVLTVLNTYAAARSIGWQDPPMDGLFVVVPLILIVSMVPLTPSGIGIQEGAFLFFLQRVGAMRSEALAVGLVLRAKVVLISLFGGLLLAMHKKR